MKSFHLNLIINWIFEVNTKPDVSLSITNCILLAVNFLLKQDIGTSMGIDPASFRA